MASDPKELEGSLQGGASSRAANRSTYRRRTQTLDLVCTELREPLIARTQLPPSVGSNSRRATVDLEVLPARILGETYERIFNRSMVEKELVHRTRREKWRC